MNIRQIVDDWLLSMDKGQWLLVVDSADDMSVFFRPDSDTQGAKPQPIAVLLRQITLNSHGSLIITTRDKRLGRRLANGSQPIEVLPMDDGDAKQLLRARGAGPSPTEADVQTLVRMLGFLPLAITQVAAFIGENQTSVATYNEIFRSTNLGKGGLLIEGLTDPRRDSESKNSVLETWKISFEQMACQSPRAAAFLSTMAVLSPGAVPSALLREDGESLLEFTKAVGILKAFSLIDADDQEMNYRMHDLVHLTTREWLEYRGKRATCEESALHVVADKFPSGESQLWDQCKKIYPHACVVEQFNPSSASMSLQKARLKQKMANYLRMRDQYGPAVKRHEEAAKEFERQLGRHDLETLSNNSDMALTLTSQGYPARAERLLRAAIVEVENLLGPQHLDTLNHLIRLAENLLYQTKFAAAEKIYRRVYTGRKAILGEAHLDTLLSLSCLGPALEFLGKFEESEVVNRRAVKGLQRILPRYHPSLYLAEIRLGFIFQKIGKLEEAEDSARRSLNDSMAICGSDHRWVALSTQTLALTLRDQGRYEEALSHTQAVVQMRERTYPRNHIFTLKALYSLGFLYHGLREYDSASSNYLDCLVRAEQSYGTFHPLPVAIRAQYLRMEAHKLDEEFNRRIYPIPRDLWTALSPKQISLLAQAVGVWDPYTHGKSQYVEFFETYCFVIGAYARQYWRLLMDGAVVAVLLLFLPLFDFMIMAFFSEASLFPYYKG